MRRIINLKIQQLFITCQQCPDNDIYNSDRHTHFLNFSENNVEHFAEDEGTFSAEK